MTGKYASSLINRPTMATHFKDFRRNLSRNMNIYRNLHKHLLDPKYSMKHRFRAGAVIMFIGVGITRASGMVDLGIVHFVADVVGYGIHGLGLIVFAHLVEKGGDKNAQ